MTAVPTLSYLDLALGALLVLANAGLSLALSLRQERALLIAAVRMGVQLTLVGLVLGTLFKAASPLLTLAAAMVMAGFAAYETRARQARALSGLWGFGVGGGAITLAAAAVTLPAVALLLHADPWRDPRYLIPLFGMILGNAMTGVSLGLNAFISGALRDRAAIEAQLALGADRWTALGPPMRAALRAGFTPIINSMAAAGVVFLPGMMTGQILAGADPEQAVRYQMLIMFLIAGATGAGVLGAVLATAWRLTDERHRLRLERVAPAKD